MRAGSWGKDVDEEAETVEDLDRRGDLRAYG